MLLDIHFMKPVRIGDILTGGGQLSREGDCSSYDVWVMTQHGDVQIGEKSKVDMLGQIGKSL
jgi:acyl-CoA hydrolase